MILEREEGVCGEKERDRDRERGKERQREAKKKEEEEEEDGFCFRVPVRASMNRSCKGS